MRTPKQSYTDPVYFVPALTVVVAWFSFVPDSRTTFSLPLRQCPHNHSPFVRQHTDSPRIDAYSVELGIWPYQEVRHEIGRNVFFWICLAHRWRSRRTLEAGHSAEHRDYLDRDWRRNPGWRRDNGLHRQ